MMNGWEMMLEAFRLYETRPMSAMARDMMDVLDQQPILARGPILIFRPNPQN